MRRIEKSESAKIGRQRADWSDLRVFYAVAETGSFSEAAAQLGLTQPTVSARIRDLESRLGVRLFNRSPHRLTLTDSGTEVLDHVVTMERSATALERLVRDKDKKDEGRVVIACPDGLATYMLVPELARFLRESPDISVGIDCGLWTDTEVGANVDISLQFDAVTNADVVATPIAYYHYCLYSSRSYLDLYGPPKSLPAVAEHSFLHHVAQTRQRDNWASKSEALQGLVNVRMATNSSSAIVEAVRHGAGVAALPSSASVFAPDLVMLDLPPMARLELRMCVHRDLIATARIRRVSDWLKRCFDPRSKPWFRAEFVHPSEFERESQPQLVTAQVG